jgi:hypothetical protein
MLAGLQLDLDNIEWIADTDAHDTANVTSPEVRRHLRLGSWTLLPTRSAGSQWNESEGLL